MLELFSVYVPPMLTLYLRLYLQPLIHKVLVHGFETRAPHSPETRQSPSQAHCSANKVIVQRRAIPSPVLIKKHSWYHLQGMLVQCGRPVSIKVLIWVHSLKEQQRRPWPSLLMSCSVLKSAASGRQAPHKDSVQEPGPGVGQPCFTLLHAGHISEEEREAYWRASQTVLTLNQLENISTLQ